MSQDSAHPLDPIQALIPSRRILLAPVGMMDPIHFGRAVDYRSSVADLIQEAKKVEAKIPKNAYLDLAKLSGELRLGPLLATVKRMAEGSPAGWDDPQKDKEINEQIREKLGEEFIRLRQPWMPDEVWLFHQDFGLNGSQSAIGVRAHFSRLLIKRLFGPWIKVCQVPVQDPQDYAQCWSALAAHVLPHFGRGGQVGQAVRLPAVPASEESDSGEEDVLDDGEDFFAWCQQMDEESLNWDAPAEASSGPVDLRILYGSGAQAMRHSLFLLDRVLPDAPGRMWEPVEPEKSEKHTAGLATASPLLWSRLGHPTLGVVEELQHELAELRAQLEEEREAMEALRERLSYALKELDPHDRR